MAKCVRVDFRSVKAQLSLSDVLQVFGIADQFVQCGKDEWKSCCPLPDHPQVPEAVREGHQRNRDQFRIKRKESGEWVWFCHAKDHAVGGDVLEFIRRMIQGDHAAVRHWLIQHVSHVLTPVGKVEARPERSPSAPAAASTAKSAGEPSETAEAKPAEAIETPAKQIKPLGFALKLQVCEYLTSRGLPAEVQRHFGAGRCLRGKFKDKAVFPIYRYPKESADENPVSYCARRIGDDPSQPKWQQFKGFEMGQFVFAINEAMADTQDGEPLILVEGPLDVLACFQSGIMGSVAPIAANLTEAQRDILVSTGRPLVIMFDGDGSGQAAMYEAAAMLVRAGCSVKTISLADGQNPADLIGDELRQIVESALA